MLKKSDKILIAGAKGMVGSALVRLLQKKGYNSLYTPSKEELDYTQTVSVRDFLQDKSPEVVIVAAAKVGGIFANMTYPAEFIYSNIMIASNLIHESYLAGVRRLLFLGSSCIYPRESPQPIPEEALLSGPLEKTNEAYALAKIAGVKMCQFYRQQYGCRFISAMPTNLYGPKDNYHRENSHVIPGLIRRFHEAKMATAKEVVIWGTGKAYREFLYVDDLAIACCHLLKTYDEPDHINIGSEDEVTIQELAMMIAEVVGFQGKIIHDLSKPDGTPRKKCSITKMQSLGWRPKTSLKDGLIRSYNDFLATESAIGFR